MSTNSTLQSILSTLDTDLRNEIMQAHTDIVRKATLRANESNKRNDLHRTMDRFSDDATGQDGDDEMNQAAGDYVDAQTKRWESEQDEDQLAEMRAGA